MKVFIITVPRQKDLSKYAFLHGEMTMSNSMNLLRRNHFLYDVTPPPTSYPHMYYGAPPRSAALGESLSKDSSSSSFI